MGTSQPTIPVSSSLGQPTLAFPAIVGSDFPLTSSPVTDDSKPNLLNRLLDGHFKKYRDQSPDGFSCHAVPFKLRPIRLSLTRQGFTESPNTSHRINVVVNGCLGAFALFLVVVGVLTRDWSMAWIGMVMLAFAALIFCLLFCFANRRARHLWIDGPNLQVHLERVDSRSEIIEQIVVPIEDCWLRVHPVDLGAARTRSGSSLHNWKGFAAVVHVRSDRFVIGCTKKREELDPYLAGLPKWLQTIRAPDGELIEASAHLRLF